ncbi:uncharacterized protein [Ptychodera flava]|uniref:uncharacterized protein n=1 Tax=Ptychodera flava TaxID=63121 RepID=UPI003969F989
MQGFSCTFILVVISCCVVALDDPKSWPFEDPNKFGVAEEIGESRFSVKPKWLYNVDGRPVAVFENNVNYKNIFALSMYQFLKSYWRYGTTLDPYNENDASNSNNVPWKSYHDTEAFANSVAGKAIQRLVQEMSGSEQTYHLYQVTDNLIRRGDVMKLHHDACREEAEFSALIYMNEIWKKNYYGETLFFDQDEEITAVVKPNYGRIVVWESSVDYLLRPPSINFNQGQKFLHFQYTTNKTKVDVGKAQRLAEMKRIREATEKIFDHKEEPVEKQINVKEHFIQEYKSSEGWRVVVFDDLFDKKDLDDLRKYTLKYGEYYYDDSLDSVSDNVQWIAGYEVKSYIKSRFWNITKQVMTHITGKDTWFPYDVSCNLVRSADHTRIHHDCDRAEEEWTFLLYLNPNWTENYYGETAYFETNDDDTEYVAEVLPVYGRVAVHEGFIPHSARPPSSLYPGARLTFAVKMSINEQVARTKMILEKHRQEEGVLRSTIPVLNHFEDDDFEDRLRDRVLNVLKADAKMQHQVHKEFEEGEIGEGDSDDEDEDDSEEEMREENEEEEEEDEYMLYDEDVPEADSRFDYLETKKAEYSDDMAKLQALSQEVVEYGWQLREDLASKLEKII